MQPTILVLLPRMSPQMPGLPLSYDGDFKGKQAEKLNFLKKHHIIIVSQVTGGQRMKLDGVAPLISDPPLASFTTLSSFLFFYV